VKDHLWIFVAIIGGFTGFLLGYSTPPMMEVGLSQASIEASSDEQSASSEDEDLARYYEELQKLKDE